MWWGDGESAGDAAPAPSGGFSFFGSSSSGDPDASAIAEIEADLQPSFDAMKSIEKSSPLKQLRAGIDSVMKQQAIIKHGFLGGHHFEQEGCDALLFGSVPPWIQFSRISGYRYRRITAIVDPDDEWELYHEGVAFYGVPGASGWADSIGDVAIHYMGPTWAVFSKVFPFAEQSEAREAHEDMLLLGASKHVMLTPCCAYRIGAPRTAHRPRRRLGRHHPPAPPAPPHQPLCVRCMCALRRGRSLRSDERDQLPPLRRLSTAQLPAIACAYRGPPPALPELGPPRERLLERDRRLAV